MRWRRAPTRHAPDLDAMARRRAPERAGIFQAQRLAGRGSWPDEQSQVTTHESRSRPRPKPFRREHEDAIGGRRGKRRMCHEYSRTAFVLDLCAHQSEYLLCGVLVKVACRLIGEQ